MLTHIPISIRPAVADLFRQSLNDSVDAVEGTPYNAVQKFTKLFLLPTCLLAAPKLRQTEAVGAGHHTLADTMKHCSVSGATHNFRRKRKRYRHLDQRTASAMSFRRRITRAVPLSLPRKVPTPRQHRHYAPTAYCLLPKK